MSKELKTEIDFFEKSLKDSDPEIFSSIDEELNRRSTRNCINEQICRRISR